MKKLTLLLVGFICLAMDSMPGEKPQVYRQGDTKRPTIEQKVQLKENELNRANSELGVQIAEIKYSN